MKNGDRVTGSIVKKDGKNLTIKTEQFGVVTTAWDQVESITADKPVNVVLQDGKTAPGHAGHGRRKSGGGRPGYQGRA